MPIATSPQHPDPFKMNINMNGPSSTGSSASASGHGYIHANSASSSSPVSPRMTKAAFFRARSPQGEHVSNQGPVSISQQISPVATAFGPNTPDSAHGYHGTANGDRRTEYATGVASTAQSYHQQQLQIQQHQSQQQRLQQRFSQGAVERSSSTQRHSQSSSVTHQQQPPSNLYKQPSYRAPGPSQPLTPTSADSTSPRDYTIGLRTNMDANSDRTPSSPAASNYTQHESAADNQSSYTEHSNVGLAGGSDEMLMTLLAGQAAVDCERMPVGGWEEVEAWKKELSLLSTRLESLVARHQREVKILTAARTLQKLNTANKRMSKQTMESLEQSEKRADAAEKEVLVLRDREAGLRRRLMEHWAGVMAWEVRRLEQVSSDARARAEKAALQMSTIKAREDEIVQKMGALQEDLVQREARNNELEAIVLDMGRRERALEEELQSLGNKHRGLEEERSNWQNQGDLDQHRAAWDEERQGFEEERKGWQMEKRMLLEDREAVVKARALDKQRGAMSERDRAMVERVRVGLGGILGRKGGVGEGEMVDAVEEVRRVLETRENEVVRLKEEMREVNMGLEEELRRVSADRDAWKAKVDSVEQTHGARGLELENKVKSHSDHISDLTLRNESLAASLTAAQAALSQAKTTTTRDLPSAPSAEVKTLQSRVEALTAELDSIAAQFNEVWSILPPPSRRAAADLVDPKTGQPNASLTSPSTVVNFAALQQVYKPHDEGFMGIDEMLNRVRGMADDGRLLVERVCRLGQDRELLKQNASRAKRLAESSQRALETYQRQVAVLEDRLATSGSSESSVLDELNSLQRALDEAKQTHRTLESNARKAEDQARSLRSANDTLSAKALSLADEHEQERRSIAQKWQDEVESLRRQLEGFKSDREEGDVRGQEQRIQLLDELNSLQAENAEMRKQLRERMRK